MRGTGNPEGRTSPGRSPWVGRESRSNIDAKQLETGYSPRDRGSRCLRPEVCRRSIPALAGDTRGTALRASLDYGSSPRGRGKSSKFAAWVEPCPRGVPGPHSRSTAGLPPHARGSATEIRLCSSVYPRTCGETLHWRRWSTPARGETVDPVCSSPVHSPLTRGCVARNEHMSGVDPRV